MKRIIVNLFIVMVLSTTISGCRKEGGEMPLSLNEKESYFDSQLSSISPDGASACFIGNEQGDIYRYDKRTGRVYDTLKTGMDRIYNVTVKRSVHDTSYLVCVRNSGLMIYRCDGGRFILERKFLIRGRLDSYSPYKTVVCGERVYVATSHGLFYKDLSKNDGNYLERLYPQQENGKMLPFLVTDLIKCGRFIYAASEGGLIRCDVATNETDVLHRGEKIKSVLLVDSCIYSLSERKLYVDGMDGGMCKEYKIGIDADIYYHADDIHYFINRDRVTVAHDRDLEEGKGYRTIPLRRNVRLECRNVIMADSMTGHSMLITDNALFRIPFHLDVFNTDGRITAACGGDGCIYIVINNSLFRMQDNGNEAERIADLPETEHITAIMFHDKTLYYVNGSSELKRKHIGDSFIENYLSEGPAVVYKASRGITTAGIGGDGSIYIGIRDSLLLLRGDKTEIVRTPDYSFVNRFVINEKNNNTYAALLNGGILRLCGEKSFVEGYSTNRRFIKDIAFPSFSTGPCVLTNHFLFSPNDKDSVAAEGASRLLTADGKVFYVLMENGIRKYRIDRNGMRHISDTLCDMRFSPSISFVHDNNIYVGATSLGVMELKPDGTSRWIKFNHDVYTPDSRTIAFIFLLECLSASFVLWHSRRKVKDFGTFSKWEEMRKNIIKINPGQVKILEEKSLDDMDSMGRRLSDGQAWLVRHEAVKNMAEELKKLTELEVFPYIFERSMRRDIYRLNVDIGSRVFVIDNCEELGNNIILHIMNANMGKVVREIKDGYEALKDSVDSIDSDFIVRLDCFINDCSTPCDSKDCAVERLHSVNRKYTFVKAVGCMVKIRETINRISAIKETIDIQDNEGQEIKDLAATATENLKELYYMLSQDEFLAQKINIKQYICRENVSMTGRERTLMLLIAVPEIKSEAAIHVLGHRSIGNARSALSKAKKEILSIDEEERRELCVRKDSLGKYVISKVGSK